MPRSTLVKPSCFVDIPPQLMALFGAHLAPGITPQPVFLAPLFALLRRCLAPIPERAWSKSGMARIGRFWRRPGLSAGVSRESGQADQK